MKYIKLFLILLKINFLREMEYRINFIAVLIPAGFYCLGYTLMIWTILNKVPNIAGWNFSQMLMLFSVGQFSYYLTWVLYRVSLDYFPLSIKKGDFDSIVKQPVSTRFMVSFLKQRIDVSVPMIGAVLIFAYAVSVFGVNFTNLFLFFLLLISGEIILYNFMFTAASLSFWIIEIDGLISLIDDVVGYGSYPLSIFPGPVAIFLTLIVPAIIIVYVPATAFMGILDWKLGFLSGMMVFVSWFVSQKIWHAGLRRYSSASS